jgi:hypothetical protein
VLFEKMRTGGSPLAQRLLAISTLVALTIIACSKDDPPAASKAADAGATAPAAPKNLDLAKAALVTAKAKYARHEVVNDTDCSPLRSLEADFAQDKSPDAVKTTKEIDVFCEIDVKLEGEVTTLKSDQEKLSAAQKKKDKSGEQMYGATVKDGCTTIKQHLESLARDHLDGEPKVATSKADVDAICSASAPRKK